MARFGARSFSIVMAWSVLLVWVPPARAAEAEDECRTRTLRPAAFSSSTVRRFDGRNRGAVDIVSGETLCVVGVGDGRDRVRVVARALRSQSVEIQLEATQDGTTLAVRHGLSAVLEFKVGVPAGRTADIIVTDRGQAAPGERKIFGWPQRVERLVLFDFERFPALPAVPRAILGEHNFLAINFISTIQFTSVDELNAEFVRNGFSRVSGVQPYLGFGFDGSFGGFRPNLDCNLGLERAGLGARAPGVDQVLIALNFGYAVYRREGIELFPMLGITGGDIGVDVRADDPAVAFAGLVEGEQRIRRNVSLLLVSLGADFRRELWPSQRGGLILGLRAGYGHQFWSGTWVQEDHTAPDLPGGPEVDTSGPFVRLGLGVFAH